MKSYDLLIERNFSFTRLSKLPNTAVFIAVLSFVIVLSIGILYYGKNNFESIFYIVFSCYAGLLGFLLAYNSLKKGDNSEDHLAFNQMISENANMASIVYNPNTEKIEYNSGTFHTIFGTTINNLEEIFFNPKFHPLDRSNLALLLRFDQENSFTYSLRKQVDQGIIKWINVEASKVKKNGLDYVLMHFKDITSTKQQEVTQQQYIAEMENIIQQNQYQNIRVQQLAQLITAHDMKEPLRTIKNYIQLIERRYENRLDQKGLEMMEHVSDGAYRMTQMIDDMLANTGMDAEDTKIEEVNMNLLMSEIIQDLGAKIEDTKARIQYRSLPKVDGDSRQMKHLLQNLIENALKYRSNKAPEIFIDCKKEDNVWVFTVEDNGIGIAPKHQKSIFSFFNRGQIKSGYKGMGLGLAICKKIVQNHDGDIWVHSDGEGSGSIFYFTLPAEDEVVLKTKAEVNAHAVSMRAAY